MPDCLCLTAFDLLSACLNLLICLTGSGRECHFGGQSSWWATPAVPWPGGKDCVFYVWLCVCSSPIAHANRLFWAIVWISPPSPGVNLRYPCSTWLHSLVIPIAPLLHTTPNRGTSRSNEHNQPGFQAIALWILAGQIDERTPIKPVPPPYGVVPLHRCPLPLIGWWLVDWRAPNQWDGNVVLSSGIWGSQVDISSSTPMLEVQTQRSTTKNRASWCSLK